MDVLFACTKNTRPLLPDSLRLWRSDAPLSVSAEERQHLLALGLQTLVDLRSEEEQARRPCPLRNDPAFVYHSLPVTGGNAVPASPEEVAASYLRMLDERMEEILACILGAKTGVLYFCSAGKDRTGVVSALLLERLGYERAYILDDYLRSGAALRAMPAKVNKAMIKAIGIPVRYDRVPGGRYPQMIKAKVGWAYIQWSLDTYDWRGRSTVQVMNKVKKAIQDGDVILCHDIKDNTPESTRQMVRYLEEQGYMLLTIDELFAKDGVALEPNRVYYRCQDGETGKRDDT